MLFHEALATMGCNTRRYIGQIDLKNNNKDYNYVGMLKETTSIKKRTGIL